MPDIFLSYSSKDRDMAARVEAALSAAGYKVFWDQETPTGRDWNSWIGEKLKASRAVVVLWSKTSAASRNVVHEATISIEAGKLIPVVIEPLKASDFPMGFYTVQSVSLAGFKGGDHPGMDKLMAAVQAKIGKRGGLPNIGAAMTGTLGHFSKKDVVEAPKPKRWPFAIGLAALALAGSYAAFRFLPVERSAPAAPSAARAPVAPPAAMPATAAEDLVGDWSWSGIACEQGPHVALDPNGEVLTFTMPGTPTYVHAIDRADATGVHTTVIEPDDQKDQDYTLRRDGAALFVKNDTTGKVDQWETCQVPAR